ncbi:unnamed protein product, partial [Ectocarpus fasciculatus]
GAGGHGTSRKWFVVRTKDGDREVFGKTPTSNMGESFFLNLFDVYANEVRFYDYVKRMESTTVLPNGFFPTVYATKFSAFRSRFLLLLENVDRTRTSATTKISFPELSPSVDHPLRRVLAVLDTQAQLHVEFFNRPPSCVWNKDDRPPLLQLIAQATKKDVISRFPDALSPNVLAEYDLFLTHHDVVRKHWDSGALTLVHGDAHLGNYYFAEEFNGTDVISTTARMYDFQCTAHEHPIRDVCYHILCSVDETVLAQYGGDQELLRYYLSRFNENLKKRGGDSLRTSYYLSFNDAWVQYRLHAFWVLTAFVISAGAGEKLFDGDKARFTVGRISRGCERIAAGAQLRNFLRHSGVTL